MLTPHTAHQGKAVLAAASAIADLLNDYGTDATATINYKTGVRAAVIDKVPAHPADSSSLLALQVLEGL